MGSKYRINYRQYDDICGYEYQTKWLVLAVYKLINLRFKYELVDFHTENNVHNTECVEGVKLNAKFR